MVYSSVWPPPKAEMRVNIGVNLNYLTEFSRKIYRKPRRWDLGGKEAKAIEWHQAKSQQRALLAQSLWGQGSSPLGGSPSWARSWSICLAASLSDGSRACPRNAEVPRCCQLFGFPGTASSSVGKEIRVLVSRRGRTYATGVPGNGEGPRWSNGHINCSMNMMWHTHLAFMSFPETLYDLFFLKNRLGAWMFHVFF